jgi:hypothetical protein
MSELNKNHCVVLKEGKFDTASGSNLVDLHDIFETIGHQEGTSVVLHFHGGLVDKQAGITGANHLIPIYQNAGTYPVFFVWESGWREVIDQKLPAIFGESLFQRILLHVTRFAKGKIDKGLQTGQARAMGRISLPKDSAIRSELDNPADGREAFAHVNPGDLPEGDELTDDERMQFEENLKDDTVFEIAAEGVLRDAAHSTGLGATAGDSTKTLMSPEVLGELFPAKEGAYSFVSTTMLIARCAGILWTVVKRFAERRDHGFYPTIVEEILRAFYVGNAGRLLWDTMKQDIVNSFGVTPDCGGTLFLTELDALCKGGKKPRITIVGHSAGAIYTCRFLLEVQSRGLPADLHFNVILIAPACDFNLLAKTLQSVGSRIEGLRIFGMGDDLERKDAIAPPVYPSSLLYFVAGVIEKENDCPLAGMARYYAAPYTNSLLFPDIDYVRKCPSFRKDHALVWANSMAGDGFNCDMVSHGLWACAQATVGSVVHILQNGY